MDHILRHMDAQPNRSQRLMDWTQKVFENSGIETKQLAYHPNEIHNAHHNAVHVNDACFHTAVTMCKQLTQNILRETDMKMTDISAVFVGTEVPNDMSIDSYTHIVTGGNPHIKRYSLHGKSCAGGAVNLSHAFDYLQGHPDEAVQVINIDLYSRLWTYGYRNVISEKMPHVDTQRDQMKRMRNALIPAVILGDAAVSMILLGENHPLYRFSADVDGSPVVVATGRATVPDTLHNTRFVPKPYGAVPMLHEDVPAVGVTAVRQAMEHLKEKHYVPDLLSFYCMHPGGVRVLNGLEEALNIPHELMQPAFEILRRYGNCASPTVLLELEHIMKQPMKRSNKETGLLAVVGPGMMSEVLLIERKQPMIM